jgi:KDO2-lipid IV(A) lauroyltransferase
VQENFASTGMTFFEMAISWWWPVERLRRLGTVEGVEHLQQAEADG